MSSQSEAMLNLLKELATLKAQDELPNQPRADVEARQNRREEIANQIRALGKTVE